MPPLDPMDPKRGRAGRPYREQRRKFLAVNRRCWICKRPMDYTVHPRHPLSPTVDHFKRLSHGGDPMDLANWRPAHYGCNSRRSDRPDKPMKTDRHSQVW